MRFKKYFIYIWKRYVCILEIIACRLIPFFFKFKDIFLIIPLVCACCVKLEIFYLCRNVFSLTPTYFSGRNHYRPDMNFRSTIAVFLLMVILMFATDSTYGFRKPPFNGSIFGKRTVSYPGMIILPILLLLLLYAEFYRQNLIRK